MEIETIGWDIGGAHLKAVAIDRAGAVIGVRQCACPLWLGLDRLEGAIASVAGNWPLTHTCRHAVTMTGELADGFPDRPTGVRALLDTLERMLAGPVRVFAGPAGLLATREIRGTPALWIASANWLASAQWLAPSIDTGILLDIGSTTTDVIPIRQGGVTARGYTDYERLRYDELVYAGIVRTPVMALATKAYFEGGWVGLMNEHFATSADVFRLTGELPEHADQSAAADGGSKTRAGSARRLARMIGCDLEFAPIPAWVRLARFFRERLLDLIAAAVAAQPDDPLPLIGAGTGRFLVPAIAARLNRPYRPIEDILPSSKAISEFSLADCLPAAAVAFLSRTTP